jgi:transcriptional regulator with XRE-family HTH domain
MSDYSFWARVNTLNKTKKITREKLADHIGVSLHTLKGWIYNNRIPDAFTACDIAGSLGVTVEYLVNGKDGKISEKLVQRISGSKSAAEKLRKLAREIAGEAEKMG